MELSTLRLPSEKVHFKIVQFFFVFFTKTELRTKISLNNYTLVRMPSLWIQIALIVYKYFCLF